ncbi:MAG: S8 family serine peptidase [Saprospiraceae bacterium]
MNISKLTNFITFLLFIIPFTLFSQQLDHKLGDILIQLNTKKDIHSLIDEFHFFQNDSTHIEIKKAVVPDMNIWLLHIDYVNVDELLFLEKIRRHSSVLNAQFNHFTSLRSTIPNDSEFPNQWQYLNDGTNGAIADADIDADLAWDIATGGVTANGDTIVICVIDAGVDHDHEDLVGNIWINQAEIEGNGIDDDNNGFTDDVRGWNSFSMTDNVFNNNDHGTSVTGIIGAKGDNNIGVTGVNWNIKTMIVIGGSGAEDEVLISYSYPLSHRKKYNETNGAEGAFVVATNASWGVDEGMASDFPLWCAFYDTLGQYGILNCGATANDNINVEIDGDMPTSCTSDFLISVTNTNSSDIKHSDAAYGATSIDLGAPGAMAWAIEPDDNYGFFAGTSAATPHVTGAIGLLYAAPCSNLPALALNDPSAAALLVKNYIFNGVDPNVSLDGITFTGGRLNVNNSIQMLMDSCGVCPAPSSLSTTNTIDISTTLTWVEADSTLSSNIRFRELPNGNWVNFMDVESPFLLDNLTGCMDYEVQVESVCSNEQSGFIYSHFFSTEGCCVAPDDLVLISVNSNTAEIDWSDIFAANNGYHLFLTSTDPNIQPMSISTNTSQFSFFELENCTEYLVNVQADCDTSISDFSEYLTFQTTGCGACRDLPYCEIESDGASLEWIANVTFNTLNNTTLSDGGYGDFTLLTDTEIEAGETYEISVSPGYSGSNFLEYFRAWIDYNHDGDFDDDGETILAPTDDVNTTVTNNVTIPTNAISGSTRMRVLMRWGGTNISNPPPCEDIDFGEIEDYCVSIIGGSGIPCSATNMIDTTLVTLNNLNIAWDAPATSYESFLIEYRKEGAMSWDSKESVTLEELITDLEKCSSYEFRIQTICDATTLSDFSDIFIFNTKCDVSIGEMKNEISKVEIFPNPFTENIFVTFSLSEKTTIETELMTVDGQVIFNTFSKKNQGQHSIEISDLKNLPHGIYFFKIKTNNNFIIKKIVK